MNLRFARVLGFLGPALLVGCSGSDAAEEPESQTAIVSGTAALFTDAIGTRIANGKVSVLEHPGVFATTAADGAFTLPALPVGHEVTLVLEHPDYPLIQTGTHVLPADGLDDLSFQVPSPAIYDLLASIVGLTPDPTRCQLVTTVTRKGGTIFNPGAHGEAGVTVTSAPEMTGGSGLVYFNASVVPDRSLSETSEDGGVLYGNVEPGTYVWSGHKAGADLADVTFKCRAGVVVNASPPRGMNVL